MNSSDSKSAQRSSYQIEANQSRENRFQLAFENSSLGIAIIGLDFRIEQANSSLGRLLGCVPLDLIGLEYLSITHEGHRERHSTLAQKLMRGEIEGYKLKENVTRKDGAQVSVSVGVRLMRDSRGEASYILATLEAVTTKPISLAEENPAERQSANVEVQIHQMVASEGKGGRLADVERDHITKVLERTLWRIEGPKGAAAILGVNPATLRSRMKRLGINRPRTK